MTSSQRFPCSAHDSTRQSNDSSNDEDYIRSVSTKGESCERVTFDGSHRAWQTHSFFRFHNTRQRTKPCTIIEMSYNLSFFNAHVSYLSRQQLSRLAYLWHKVNIRRDNYTRNPWWIVIMNFLHVHALRYATVETKICKALRPGAFRCLRPKTPKRLKFFIGSNHSRQPVK